MGVDADEQEGGVLRSLLNLLSLIRTHCLEMS